jgi:selenocysteine-specific translation elongation factor
MPRSDYEHSGRLVEMGEITPEPQLYIDVSVIEYETMKKRIAELEAALGNLLDAWKKPGAPILSEIDHAFHVLGRGKP